MPDPIQLEHDAEIENREGHRASFAAHHHKVRDQLQAAQERLTDAAQHYDTAARHFTNAAEERLTRSEDQAPERTRQERAAAETDYGRAASDYWYAGRAHADAGDFERAAEAMEAAAVTGIDEARLHEQDAEAEEASTLRTIACFRYLDAQRYYAQAAGLHRRFALDFAAGGDGRASDLERRARLAADKAETEGPNYHADFQSAYQ